MEGRNMIGMNIKLDGDNAWPELKDKPCIHLANGAPPISVAVRRDHGAAVLHGSQGDHGALS
jgi:hypothetical protein